jgi:hypothetical protein
MFTELTTHYVFHKEEPDKSQTSTIIASKEEFVSFLESTGIPTANLKLDFTLNKITVNDEFVFTLDKCVSCSEKDVIRFFIGDASK